MRDHFQRLADRLTDRVADPQVLLMTFQGEDSDFVRFNRSQVRQPGHVTQQHLGLDLVDGQRHAPGSLTLSGDLEIDLQRATDLLDELRARLPHLPEDPHLLYHDARAPATAHEDADRLPRAADMVDRVLAAGRGRDLVGLLAQGGVCRGFASSLGLRHWFASHSFNLDWSFYLRGDKAVKCSYAGCQWNDDAFAARIDEAAAQLEILGRPARRIPPGRYRVYLAPAALADTVGLLSWGGFGLKSLRTRQSPLLRLHTDGARLHPSIGLSENTRDGVAPPFQAAGFPRPGTVHLIRGGVPADCLVSPRSAREFGAPTNGADSDEAPASLDMAPGEVPRQQVLAHLDRGVWIGNVWYLNYSDRPACRITGMTRFACFWVEDGQIEAPIEVMRFDESLLRALGDNLIGLTRERDFLIDPGTYGGRSTVSVRVPGALVEDFTFNL